MKTAREHAIEIGMAICDWKLGRPLYEQILASNSQIGRDASKMIAKIEAAIERDRLEVLGARVAKLCLEREAK